MAIAYDAILKVPKNRFESKPQDVIEAYICDMYGCEVVGVNFVDQSYTDECGSFHEQGYYEVMVVHQ